MGRERPRVQQALSTLGSHFSSWLHRRKSGLDFDHCHWACERPPCSLYARWQTAGQKKEESQAEYSACEGGRSKGGEEADDVIHTVTGHLRAAKF